MSGLVIVDLNIVLFKAVSAMPEYVINCPLYPELSGVKVDHLAPLLLLLSHQYEKSERSSVAAEKVK
jgi:hypothetical protein